jgi:hypothetical protein
MLRCARSSIGLLTNAVQPLAGVRKRLGEGKSEVLRSFSEGITTRDNNKMTRLILSQAYRDLWGDRGWIDPRALDEHGEVLSPQEMAQFDGDLAWPERFDRAFDRNTEYEVGSFCLRRPVRAKAASSSENTGRTTSPPRPANSPTWTSSGVSVDPSKGSEECDEVLLLVPGQLRAKD